MKIASVEAWPFHEERDTAQVSGGAGSPAQLTGAGPYRWAENYPVLYSTRFETALIKVTLASGEVGWGEAQAPLAPEVACAIVTHILSPVLQDVDFEPTPAGISQLWWTMYSAMRVRGQTGGFMLDAIAGIDLALWDVAGKLTRQTVAAMLGANRTIVPAYLSGLPRRDPEAIRPWVDRGFTTVKVFHDSGESTLLHNLDAVRKLLPASGSVAVDALWRFAPDSAEAFSHHLAARGVKWLEAPLNPESARDHGTLARRAAVPIALGESYRTLFELDPFFHEHAMAIVQPDLGRTGITEGLRIAHAAAAHGLAVIPHVSIALGPQLAAAIHFAAALENCPMLEFNPTVLDTANRFLRAPLQLEGSNYTVPQLPGLGIEMLPGSVVMQ